ncbi:MAG: hypothetical protein V4692_13820 [Bdellovibrionota bacterium]
MSLKSLLIAAAMSVLSIVFMSTDAQAAVALVHCKAPTKQLELFIPYTVGGVNPVVGTIRLTRGSKMYVEAGNEDVVAYSNNVSDISFTIADAAEKTVLSGEFKFNEERGRYIGFIKYAGAKIGMTCTSEI